jgi:hypothetical protein
VSPRALATAVVVGIVLFFTAFGGSAYLAREPRRSLAECGASGVVAEPSESGVSYEHDVAPLLALRCVRCHNLEQPRAGVRLDDYEAARSCALSDHAAESRLLAVVRKRHAPAHTLDATSLYLLERWVCGGAAR